MGYLNVVQMDGGPAAPDPKLKKRNETMSALSNIGRLFDATVAVAFVLISLSLAGATAAVGV